MLNISNANLEFKESKVILVNLKEKIIANKHLILDCIDFDSVFSIIDPKNLSCFGIDACC